MEITWKTLLRWNTGYSADSVEWCPLVPYQDVLVCGTYQLDKCDEEQSRNIKQTRLGRIYLFIIDKNTEELCPIQTINSAGILDQKWCHHLIQGFPVLGAVTSEGRVQLYRLQDVDGSLRLKLWMEATMGENLLALSLDWCNNKFSSTEPSLAVSDSAGIVKVLTISESGCLEEIAMRQAHGFEAWTTAFNYWNTDVFYSGGDDCLFRAYDLRIPDAVITNNSHEAGVTAIRSDLDTEHCLLTGSYDEKVRLWDTRSLKRCVLETGVDGGVWRLKWHPRTRGFILAACMYGGFRVLEATGEQLENREEGEKLKAVCKYEQHESIAYGADWNHGSALVATCSFYDCKMHIGEILLE